MRMSYLLAVHLDVSNIVFKHCGNIDFRELILAEDYKKAGLPTSSISNYHQLLTDGCHPWRRRMRRGSTTRR